MYSQVVVFCTHTTTKLHATTYGWLSTDTTIQVHGSSSAQCTRLANVSIGTAENMCTVECVGECTQVEQPNVYKCSETEQPNLSD